jgi:tyrosine aminotransferase
MPNIISKSKKLEMSDFARRTLNPHRIMVESSKVKPNPNKEVITLQLGDPTIFGNFSHPPEVVAAIHRALDRDTFSYYPTNGLKEAREAVAKYIGENVTADDVILTSGGSSSLELCFYVLANPGRIFILFLVLLIKELKIKI